MENFNKSCLQVSDPTQPDRRNRKHVAKLCLEGAELRQVQSTSTGPNVKQWKISNVLVVTWFWWLTFDSERVNSAYDMSVSSDMFLTHSDFNIEMALLKKK